MLFGTDVSFVFAKACCVCTSNHVIVTGVSRLATCSCIAFMWGGLDIRPPLKVVPSSSRLPSKL